MCLVPMVDVYIHLVLTQRLAIPITLFWHVHNVIDMFLNMKILCVTSMIYLYLSDIWFQISKVKLSYACTCLHTLCFLDGNQSSTPSWSIISSYHLISRWNHQNIFLGYYGWDLQVIMKLYNVLVNSNQETIIYFHVC